MTEAGITPMPEIPPTSSQTVRYEFRAYPTIQQQSEFHRASEGARVVFNGHLWMNGFGVYGPRLEYKKKFRSQAILVTGAKKTPEGRWLADLPDTPLRQSVSDADGACQRFFQSVSNAGKHAIVNQPRYKSPNAPHQAIRFAKSDIELTRISASRAVLRLPKRLGLWSIRLSRDLPARPSSVTIIKRADGQYFASFVVVRQTELLPQITRWAGVDLGLTDLVSVVYSDGTREKVPAPAYLQQARKKIAVAKSQVTRAQSDSKNHEKLRLKLASIHREVGDRRADHHHKLAHRLVNSNQVIAFETLDIVEMAHDHFKKAVDDAGWGTLIKLVGHKAERYGRKVIQIDRYEPTTQTCAPCGVRNGPKDLSIREWRCSNCDVLLDRDFNATVNILVAAGCAETLNASGRALRILLARAVPKAGTSGGVTAGP